MKLLTPSEKLFILENKSLPKKEVERIANVLKEKFRFSENRPNSNLIRTYLEKVEIGKDGKVNRNQEYIRRISKILDNANTELVAKQIEHALATKGVYEFKIPANLMSKAKELANQIVDNGFSYKEFVEWLNGAKAYKNDADDIMRIGDIEDLSQLYTQLLGTANESESTNEAFEGTVLVVRPDDINAFKQFDSLQDHLQKNYKAGVDYDIMASGDLRFKPELAEGDQSIADAMVNLVDYTESTTNTNEGKMQIKRPYKRNGVELKPGITVAEEAVMRNKIVKFLGSQSLFRASKTAILEYFNTLNEDVEVGRTPSSGWLYRNSHLVKKIKVGKDTYYKLTRAGLNLFNKINQTVNEANDVVSQDDKLTQLKEKGVPVYKDTDSGEIVYISKVGNDHFGLFDLNDTELALEKSISDIKGAYNLEELETSNEAFSITDILDIENAKKLIKDCPKDEVCILIPHYSINVQSKYEDGEELENDLHDLERELGINLQVNDYDDLVADPHGVLSDEMNEAHEDEVIDALVPYHTLVHDDEGFTNLQIQRGGKAFTFETATEVPHHYEDGKTEIQKFEVGIDGDDIYCLFHNNGDETILKSPEDLKEYTGAGSANEAMSEAELEATKDWFSTLSEEERDGFMDRYREETGENLGDFQGTGDKAAVASAKAFWKWLAGEQQVAMQEAKNSPYEIIVMGDQDVKNELKNEIEQSLPDNIIIAGEDFGVIIYDEIDREIFDKAFNRLPDSSGLLIQAFKNDAPVDLKPHAEMIKESVDANEYFTVQQPTKDQIVTYRALQMYLKRHFHSGKDYNTTSSGTLRIKRAIQEKLIPYLKNLDVIQPEAK